MNRKLKLTVRLMDIALSGGMVEARTISTRGGGLWAVYQKGDNRAMLMQFHGLLGTYSITLQPHEALKLVEERWEDRIGASE